MCMYHSLNIAQKLGDSTVCLLMHPTAIIKSELQNVIENKIKAQ